MTNYLPLLRVATIDKKMFHVEQLNPISILEDVGTIEVQQSDFEKYQIAVFFKNKYFGLIVKPHNKSLTNLQNIYNQRPYEIL